MNHHPPMRRAGRLPGSRPGTPAAGVWLLLLVGLALAGCATVPPSPPASATTPAATNSPSAGTTAGPADAAGLVIAALEGTPSIGLVGADGRIASLPPPPRPVVQLRSRADGLLAVLDDGTLALGTPDAAAGGWKRAPGVTGLAAVAAEPSGARLALLQKDRVGTGLDLRLGIAHAGAGPATFIDSSGLEANGGPSWLSGDRIALRALGRGEKDVVALVDPGTGKATTIPLDAIDLFSSRDGLMVAFAGIDSLRVGRSADVAAAMGGTIVAVPTDPAGGQLADVALDASGTRIAYVWADADNVPLSIRICSAAAGWRETSRIDVPSGATRVLLAWTG